MGAKDKANMAFKLRETMVVAIAAGVLAVLLGLSLGVGRAWAGGAPGYAVLEDLGGKVYTTYYKGKDLDSGYRSYASEKGSNKKITNAKSSNKKVATAKVEHYDGHYFLAITIKKTGTTKISYKFGGKKHTVKYVVKKYANPIKSLKIGSKEYASAFDPGMVRYNSAYAKASAFNGKLSIKLAKGWKLGKIWIPGNPMKYVKNNGKVSKATSIGLYVRKGKQKEQLWLTALNKKQYKEATKGLKAASL